jgi:acetolactate synthase-1/2/3 large subunit
LMTAAELQTAAREGIKVCMVVFDNQQYGTIRMWQQKSFPERQIATELGTSDLAGCAAALGAWAAEVDHLAGFESAFADALACDGPAVVVVRTDPEQIAVSRRDGDLPR